MSARRLLLVEDSSTMRRMISTLLADEGYEIKTAVDGNDGLLKAREDPRPELILTDYEMPELDGPGFCRAVKADKELCQIPVLMLTTLGETKSKVEGLDAGADDYIQKPKSPGDIEELFARIRAHFRLADMGTELAEREPVARGGPQEDPVRTRTWPGRSALPLMPPPASAAWGACSARPSATTTRPTSSAATSTTSTDSKRTDSACSSPTVSGPRAWNSAMQFPAWSRPLSVGLSVTSRSWSRCEMLAGLDVSLEQYFPEGYFCTGFYLIADEETGLVRYAGVGHPPAIIVGPNGTRTLESNPGLLGVGMVDGTAGSSDRIAPGESLVIYTDGLPDAMDPSDVLFGEERLKAVLQSHHGADPAKILDEVEQAVSKHTFPGSAADDINMVVIQHPVP